MDKAAEREDELSSILSPGRRKKKHKKDLQADGSDDNADTAPAEDMQISIGMISPGNKLFDVDVVVFYEVHYLAGIAHA